jgi:hypothetical protein
MKSGYATPGLVDELLLAAQTGTDVTLSCVDARNLCDLIAQVEIDAPFLVRWERNALAARLRELFP